MIDAIYQMGRTAYLLDKPNDPNREDNSKLAGFSVLMEVLAKNKKDEPMSVDFDKIAARNDVIIEKSKLPDDDPLVKKARELRDELNKLEDAIAARA